MGLFSVLLIRGLLVLGVSEVPQLCFRAAFRVFSLPLSKPQKMKIQNSWQCLFGWFLEAEDDLEAAALLYFLCTAAHLWGAGREEEKGILQETEIALKSVLFALFSHLGSLCCFVQGKMLFVLSPGQLFR